MDLCKTINDGWYYKSNIINMGETPLYLKLFHKKEKKVFGITQNQDKIRISCLLSICGGGNKLVFI